MSPARRSGARGLGDGLAYRAQPLARKVEHRERGKCDECETCAGNRQRPVQPRLRSAVLRKAQIVQHRQVPGPAFGTDDRKGRDEYAVAVAFDRRECARFAAR